MRIDPDVAKVAGHFGLDPQLIQAVVKAEGDILKAVRCSFPNTPDREKALDITCRSAVHAMSDYIKDQRSQQQSFVDFWAARWAPIGAANDPNNLNRHWAKNVSTLWLGPFNT